MTTKDEKDVDKIDKLVRTLHGLSVDDSNYAVAYARLLVAAPTVADRILPPLRWTRSSGGGHRVSGLHSASPSARSQQSTRGGLSLRRVQSFVSYQLCPSCAHDQHLVHRHHAM